MDSAILYTKRPPNEATALDLLDAGGYILKQGAGLFVLLPKGVALLRNIESIVRKEARIAGFYELRAPALQNSDLWAGSGRLGRFNECMFHTAGNNSVDYVLGATNEELFTKIVDARMPGESLKFYSLGERFRNEYRPTSGLVRSNSFYLADFYYISSDADDVKNVGVEKLAVLLKNIVSRLGFEINVAIRMFDEKLDEASQGALYSYWTESCSKQCTVYACPDCGKSYRAEFNCCPNCSAILKRIDATELGDVSYLGNSISKGMQAADLISSESFMAIAGIGLTRCMQLLAEKHQLGQGFVWPRELAPFDIEVISNEARLEEAEKLVYKLRAVSNKVLFDDRKCGLGRKFIDADLIGAPIRITLGNNTSFGVFELLREDRIEEKASASDIIQRLEE